MQSKAIFQEGLPPPSECLATQIDFVRSNTGPPDEAMQAVLDNACWSLKEIGF